MASDSESVPVAEREYSEDQQNLVRFQPPGTTRDPRRGEVFNVEYSEYDGLTYYVRDKDGQQYQLDAERVRVVMGVRCPRCDGAETYVNCFDDICHAKGRCMHGNNTCPTCEGEGVVTDEFADEYSRVRFGGEE